MNITELFIKRPVMTALVMMGILLFGIVGYRALPVNDLPIIDFPTLQVQASLPGASPETMAASVATPLERQFSTVPGLDSMSSSSVRGGTNITLQFVLDRNIDAAGEDVQAAIAAVLRRLPPNMPAPPTVRKGEPRRSPILFMVAQLQGALIAGGGRVRRDHDRPPHLHHQRRCPGNVFGAAKYAVRIQLDPSQLAARGIGIDEVEAAVMQHNVNIPAGTLWGPHQAFTVEATGQLMTAPAYRPMVVTYRNGSPVRLARSGPSPR